MLVSPSIAAAISPAHKKRVCQHCYSIAPKRLHLCCRTQCTPVNTQYHTIHTGTCQQAFYCSEACQARDARPTGSHRPPHAHVCRILQHFSSCKCDAEMENVRAALSDTATISRCRCSEWHWTFLSCVTSPLSPHQHRLLLPCCVLVGSCSTGRPAGTTLSCCRATQTSCHPSTSACLWSAVL